MYVCLQTAAGYPLLMPEAGLRFAEKPPLLVIDFMKVAAKDLTSSSSFELLPAPTVLGGGSILFPVVRRMT